MTIDLLFPVEGTTLPGDHAYLLYGALSGVVPAFHRAESKARFASITGEPARPRSRRINKGSCLRVRLPADEMEQVLPLAGQALKVAGSPVRLGFPTVVPLAAVPTLYARVVTYKHATGPEKFLETTREKLGQMGIEAEAAIPLIERGPREGQPQRRVVRIKGVALVGYTLILGGLGAEESLRLQEEGLGGRTRIGCGLFVPYRPR